MREMLKFLRHYRGKAVAGLVFKMLAAGMELTIPLIMANMINGGADQRRIYALGGLILVVVLVNITFDLTCQYLASVSSAGIGAQIRAALFEKINRLSFENLDELGTASMTTRITSDVTQVQQATAMGIRLLSRAPFIAVGAVLMAMAINMRMSLLFLFVAVLVLSASLLIRRFCAPMYTAVQRGLDRVVLSVKETLEGIRVFSAFNMQSLKGSQFDDASAEYKDRIMHVNRIASLLSPLNQLIINTAVVAVVWLGGKASFLGEMPVGDIMALTSYLFQVFLAMNIISHLIVIFTKAEASAQRISEILHAECTLFEGSVLQGKANAPIVQFDRVSFQYPGSAKPQLRDISFSIHKGERVGIIGGTGSGKTTLIQLIARTYDVKDGAVLVEGVDVRDWQSGALRDKIAIARQRAQLLNATVRENIQFGQESLGEAGIQGAAQWAEASEFIDNLSGGYDHLIDQEGRNLSGGQKQRLCLARALARDAELLIIDNALSALDFLTESRVRANLNLRREAKGQTLILICERVLALRACDKILVMQEGELVAIGDHETLMKGCELYREIAASQLG